MTGTRIDFASADAARFNALRDEWRSAAASCALSRSAMRIATVLPTYVSREFGYAFPTDEQLASEIKADAKTAKRGLAALEKAALVERVIQPKRGDRGEVTGKLRRIYLCLPTEGTAIAQPKGQNAPSPKGQHDDEPKGQLPKGQAQPKGQKSTTEGTPVCPYIHDRTTPDSRIRSGDRKVSVYEGPSRPVPSVTRPSPVPSVRNPYPAPKAFGDDLDFLAAFDRFVLEVAGDEIGAGEIERITGEAFNRATDSDEMFMPFHWPEVCALRDPTIAEWFRWRAGTLIHRKEAA